MEGRRVSGMKDSSDPPVRQIIINIPLICDARIYVPMFWLDSGGVNLRSRFSRL